jgi:hypothetical protein
MDRQTDSQAETEFARYSVRLIKLLYDDIRPWTSKLHEVAGREAFLGNYHFCEMRPAFFPADQAVWGQISVDSMRFVSPKTGQREAVEIHLGHDKHWKPIVNVLSSYTEPVVIKCTGVPADDMALVREQILQCFDAAGVNLR